MPWHHLYTSSGGGSESGAGRLHGHPGCPVPVVPEPRPPSVGETLAYLLQVLRDIKFKDLFGHVPNKTIQIYLGPLGEDMDRIA